MKVLHAPANTSSLNSTTVTALRQIGVEARGLVIGGSSVTSYESIKVVRSRITGPRRIILSTKWFYELLKGLLWADVLHWYSGKIILPWRMDLRLAGSFVESRFVEWTGSDIRIPEREADENPYYRRLYKEGLIEKVLKESREKSVYRQLLFSKLGFSFLVSHSTADYVLDNIDVPVYLVPIRILVSRFQPRYPETNKDKPHIVHMSTNFMIKGTDLVIKAVKRLRNRADFRFTLIHNVEREKALEVLKTADIFLDQFILGHYGVAALEAMAFGKPVIAYIKPSALKRYPRELPVVNATEETLEEKILELIKNPELRRELGKKSRIYVEKYHDALKIARELVEEIYPHAGRPLFT